MARQAIAAGLLAAAWLAIGLQGVAPAGAQERLAGEWQVGPPMPTCRSELAATVLDGAIYVAGGLSDAGAHAEFERYDPATGQWAARARLPVGLHHLGMAAHDGAIYVSGGYDSLRMRPDRATTWRYDPAADRWQQVADMPGPRAAHVMVTLGERLYVVGGVGPDSERVWAYDPAADGWHVLPGALPTPREHLAAVAWQGRLVAIGGRWRGVGNRDTVEVLDPASGQWRRGAPMPTARGGLTAAVVQGRIHVGGGEAFRPNRTFPEHEVYDPAGNAWRVAPELPEARHGLASVGLGGRWYVIGGGAEAAMRTLFTTRCRVDVFLPPGD